MIEPSLNPHSDEQHIAGVPVRPRTRTAYDHFFDQHAAPGDDWTWGERAWNAAQREAWAAVFQIVSDRAYQVSREFVMQLEEARGLAGHGPAVDAQGSIPMITVETVVTEDVNTHERGNLYQVSADFTDLAFTSRQKAKQVAQALRRALKENQ